MHRHTDILTSRHCASWCRPTGLSCSTLLCLQLHSSVRKSDGWTEHPARGLRSQISSSNSCPKICLCRASQLGERPAQVRQEPEIKPAGITFQILLSRKSRTVQGSRRAAAFSIAGPDIPQKPGKPGCGTQAIIPAFYSTRLPILGHPNSRESLNVAFDVLSNCPSRCMLLSLCRPRNPHTDLHGFRA